MPPLPKPPAFDANSFGNALEIHVRRPDGTAYIAFEKFAPWKRWVDAQRDVDEQQRIQLNDHKVDIDEHSARLAELEQRMAAVEDRPSAPFPVV